MKLFHSWVSKTDVVLLLVCLSSLTYFLANVKCYFFQKGNNSQIYWKEIFWQGVRAYRSEHFFWKSFLDFFAKREFDRRYKQMKFIIYLQNIFILFTYSLIKYFHFCYSFFFCFWICFNCKGSSISRFCSRKFK